MFSISFRKYRAEEKETICLCAIITSTALASSAFLSSYRNTIFNQSTRVFSYCCFQVTIKVRQIIKMNLIALTTSNRVVDLKRNLGVLVNFLQLINNVIIKTLLFIQWLSSMSQPLLM